MKSKILYLIIGLFCLCVSGAAQVAVPATYLQTVKQELNKTWPDNRTIHLVFHGHSVPSGYFATPHVHTLAAYPQLVLQGVKQHYPYAVVNVLTTAIGGENAEQGAVRFSAEVLTMRPDVLFIDYALNDRGIGLEKAEKAWRDMIEAALAYGCKIILLTPTPDTSENIRDEQTPLALHAELIRQLAGQYKIGLVDNYSIFKRLSLTDRNIDQYMSQTNHPNEKGHQIVANEIMTYFTPD